MKSLRPLAMNSSNSGQSLSQLLAQDTSTPHGHSFRISSCQHLNDMTTVTSDSDTSADDDGNSNTLPSVPLNARNKPQFAESKFGRTQFIEPEGSWSKLKNHYGNHDGKSPWAYNKYQEDKRWYHPFRDQFSQSQEEVRLRPLQAIFQAQCLAIEAELVPNNLLERMASPMGNTVRLRVPNGLSCRQEAERN